MARHFPIGNHILNCVDSGVAEHNNNEYLMSLSFLTGSGANPVPQSSFTSNAKLRIHQWSNPLRNIAQQSAGTYL
jgi:hypothetical protein